MIEVIVTIVRQRYEVPDSTTEEDQFSGAPYVETTIGRMEFDTEEALATFMAAGEIAAAASEKLTAS